MDIHDYAHALRKFFAMIVALVVAGLSLGAVAAMVMPPRYDATTSLYITADPGSGSLRDVSLGTSYVRSIIPSYAGLVQSTMVLEPALEQIGSEVTAADLSARVWVGTELESSRMIVSVHARSATQSAREANAIADSFRRVVQDQLEKTADGRAPSVRVEIIQPAVVPLVATSPRLLVYTGAGGVLGLLGGILLAVLRFSTDSEVRTARDLGQAISAAQLGAIPFDDRASDHPLADAYGHFDARAESFRGVRTNLDFVLGTQSPRSFAITSAGPGEGKSTTSSNVANAFAETGLRVLLIDGDLRLPRLHEYFGIDGELGLADVLAGRVDATDVMHRWGRGSLFILPAGTRPPNPSEVLGSARMEALVNAMAAVFDVIIIDAPPLLLVTDAAVVSRYTQGSVVVAASGRASAKRLRDVVASIEAAGSSVLGTVLTMADAESDIPAYGVPA